MAVAVPFKSACEEYNEETKGLLIKLSQLLYHIYLFPEDERDLASLGVMKSINDIDEFILNNRSLVTQAVLGLSTGLDIEQIIPFGNESNQYQSNNWYAVWVAVEMLRRAKSGAPGILQDLLQHHLTIYKTAQHVKDVLSRFCIASSRNR